MLVALDLSTTLEYRGNRLWSNAGDQLAFESDAPWTIGPASCGPDTNVFACVTAPPDFAIRIFTFGSGSVNAPFNRWPGPSNSPYQDYIGPPVSVVPDNAFCGPGAGVPDMPACIP